jgi:hypothetical protein
MKDRECDMKKVFWCIGSLMILSIFFMGSHKVLADENEHLYVKNVQISDVEKKGIKRLCK